MKKNKGFTVIELLVTFTLIMVMVIFLVQIILVLKDLYIYNGTKTELLNKQSLLSYKINQEFITKELQTANKCGVNCINFVFYDGTSTKLEIDKENKTISFGNYKTELISGSEFGEIDVTTNLSLVSDNTKNNAILNINIPIYNKLFDNTDYGVNVNLQYNTSNTNVTNIIFDDQNTTNGYLMLKGSSTVTIAKDSNYIDMGYVYFDQLGNAYDSSIYVSVTNPFDTLTSPYNLGTYNIIYKLKDSQGNIIQSIERKVTVIES